MSNYDASAFYLLLITAHAFTVGGILWFFRSTRPRTLMEEYEAHGDVPNTEEVRRG